VKLIGSVPYAVLGFTLTALGNTITLSDRLKFQQELVSIKYVEETICCAFIHFVPVKQTS
jgi:hypothetical protein